MNLALLFLCCMGTHSAIEAPKPKTVHKFYDRPAKIELVAWTSVGAFDMAQTCHNLAQNLTHDGEKQILTSEAWLPVQSCPKLVGLSFAAVGVEELARYALHRTHHHKLERLVPLIALGGNLAAIIYSKQHGAF